MIIMNEVILTGDNGIEAAKEKGRKYQRASKANNTRKAYQTDWNQFFSWCNSKGFQPIPASAETVEAYILHLADEKNLKPSTIRRKTSSIAMAHRTANLFDVTKTEQVKMTLQGIERVKGVRPDGKKPISVHDLKQMVSTLDDLIKGIRDRALLLLGFAGAFRRSELVSLNVEDLDFTSDGLKVLLRRSKTDQRGEGFTKGILYGSISDYCPIRSVKKWIEIAGLEDGPLFRPIDRHGNVKEKRLDSRAVALVVKETAQKAGLDPERFSGHSLRVGFVTSAAMAGHPEWLIMQQTGHKTHETVRRYIRDVNIFKRNASANIGL